MSRPFFLPCLDHSCSFLVPSLSPTLIYMTQFEILSYRPKKGLDKHYDSEKLFFGPPGDQGEKDNFGGRCCLSVPDF